MKKLIIIVIGAFTLLFGVNVKGSTFYTLDTPEEYFYYAKDYYTRTNNSALFQNAWQDMKEVDGAEIERDSTNSTQYGKLQYPNGEDNGVIIPNSVTSIGKLAFSAWSANNQPLVIPNSVISIGVGAFGMWSSNDKPLVIPDSINSVGSNAFYGWSSNNQPLVIPNSVTSIGALAFFYWPVNNQPLIIPNSVTSIGEQAFAYWSNVPYIEMKSETPPTLGGSSAFSYQNDAPIYVPDESVDAYKTATQWSKLANRIFPVSERSEYDRVSQLPNLFIDLFNEITDNFVIGIKGFTELIYLPGYGLRDLGYIVLIVISISVIGVAFYIIRKVIK